MRWPDRLTPRSITAQIGVVVATSVFLGLIAFALILFFMIGPPPNPGSPPFLGLRIAQISKLIKAAKSDEEIALIEQSFQHSELSVKRVTLDELAPIEQGGRSLWSRLALRRVLMEPGVEVLDGVRYPHGSPGQIIVRLDDKHALVFGTAFEPSLLPHVITQSALLLMIVMISVLLISIYALRWIIAPLKQLARAASAFGKSPSAYQLLDRKGPREIVRVTDALNDMSTRIQTLIDNRTRMLAAISHDLRTPLTRLRLRAEKVGEDGLRAGMLDDLVKIGRMIDETLEFLRDDSQSETASRIDLCSLLRTICSEFSDVGYTVRFEGPARMAYQGRPRALSRAITNIVENATKVGSEVIVQLSIAPSGDIEIAVSDDGPGIPEELHDKVFEPFFKADDARSAEPGSFGLGLSIAKDIIRRHGGRIDLRQREPKGLQVAVVLPHADDVSRETESGAIA